MKTSPNFRPTKTVIRLALYLGLLAAGVAVALLVHQRWFAPQGGPQQPVRAPQAGKPRHSQTPGRSAASGPAGLLDEARHLGAEVDNDPGGIAPPPGASRQYARRSDDRHWASYEFPGEIDPAAEYYLDALKAAGFMFTTRTDDSGWTRIVFTGKAGRGTVLLRPAGNGTKIIVTLFEQP